MSKAKGLEQVIAALTRAGNNAVAALPAALQRGAEEVAAAARANVNDRTGALADSIRVEMSVEAGKVTASIVAGSEKAWYASLVEHDTAPHIIDAVAADSLSFNGVAVEQVHHPGTRGNAYLRPAADARKGAVLASVAQSLRDSVGNVS